MLMNDSYLVRGRVGRRTSPGFQVHLGLVPDCGSRDVHRNQIGRAARGPEKIIVQLSTTPKNVNLDR